MENNLLKLFPWDNGESPYWTNPENGVEWYVDKSLTEWCIRETLNNDPKLDAMVFYVCENKDGKVNPLDRVLISKGTNDVLYSATSMEEMAGRIDILRVSKSYQ